MSDQKENTQPMTVDDMYSIISKNLDQTLENFKTHVMPQLAQSVISKLSEFYTTSIYKQLGISPWGTLDEDYIRKHPDCVGYVLLEKSKELAKTLTEELKKKIGEVKYTDLQITKIKQRYQELIKNSVERELFNHESVYRKVKDMTEHMLEQKLGVVGNVTDLDRRINTQL